MRKVARWLILCYFPVEFSSTIRLQRWSLEVTKVHKPKIIAGNEALLARRYATALMELAEEQKVLNEVAKDVKVLQEVIDSDKIFHLIANHPRLPVSAMEKLMKEIVVRAKLHELTGSFLALVAKGRRMGILGLMIDVFQADLAQHRNEHTAYVTAAEHLSDDQKESLSKQLAILTGGTVKIIADKDESLMGGLVIKIGSRLLDASLKGKMALLARHLKSQQEAA
jgi:F-type H+-transporting ATPase subunit delta